MNKSLIILSRILVAAIFVVSGIGKLLRFHQNIAVAASAGIPYPNVAIAIALLIELGGGLAILFGWNVRLASLVLILYLIPVTWFFHAAKLATSQIQMVEVLKNLAILGGLLRFYADSPRGFARLRKAIPRMAA